MPGVLVPRVPGAKVHSRKGGALPTTYRALRMPLGLVVMVSRWLCEHGGCRYHGVGVVSFTLDGKLTVGKGGKDGEEFLLLSLKVTEGINVNVVNVIGMTENIKEADGGILIYPIE